MKIRIAVTLAVLGLLTNYIQILKQEIVQIYTRGGENVQEVYSYWKTQTMKTCGKIVNNCYDWEYLQKLTSLNVRL